MATVRIVIGRNVRAYDTFDLDDTVDAELLRLFELTVEYGDEEAVTELAARLDASDINPVLSEYDGADQPDYAALYDDSEEN